MGKPRKGFISPQRDGRAKRTRNATDGRRSGRFARPNRTGAPSRGCQQQGEPRVGARVYLHDARAPRTPRGKWRRGQQMLSGRCGGVLLLWWRWRRWRRLLGFLLRRWWRWRVDGVAVSDRLMIRVGRRAGRARAAGRTGAARRTGACRSRACSGALSAAVAAGAGGGLDDAVDVAAMAHEVASQPKPGRADVTREGTLFKMHGLDMLDHITMQTKAHMTSLTSMLSCILMALHMTIQITTSAKAISTNLTHKRAFTIMRCAHMFHQQVLMSIFSVTFLALERSCILMHGSYMFLHIGIGFESSRTSRTHKFLSILFLRHDSIPEHIPWCPHGMLWIRHVSADGERGRGGSGGVQGGWSESPCLQCGDLCLWDAVDDDARPWLRGACGGGL